VQVKDLIEREGKVVTLKRIKEEPTDWTDQPIYEEVQTKAIIRECNTTEREILAGIETSELLTLILYEAVDIRDVVIIDDIEYEVVYRERVFVKDKVLYYKAIVSRGSL